MPSASGEAMHGKEREMNNRQTEWKYPYETKDPVIGGQISFSDGDRSKFNISAGTAYEFKPYVPPTPEISITKVMLTIVIATAATTALTGVVLTIVRGVLA